MKKSLSSIFSFDAMLNPGDRWRGASVSIAAALVVLIAGEWGARKITSAAGTAWQYWDARAAAKFELYAQASQQSPHTLLVTGDSTAQQNFAGDSFQLPTGWEAWNIGWSGNFAMAFEKTTLPVVRQSRPAVLVVSLIPTTFFAGDLPTKSEAGILSSAYCQAAENRWQLSKYSHMARLRPALRVLDWAAAKNDVQINHGFFVKEGSAPRRNDTIGINADDHSHLSERRLAVVENLLAICRDGDVEVILVMPPTLDNSPRRKEMNAEYLQELKRLKVNYPFSLVDCSEGVFDESDFYDKNHLNTSGAKKLSGVIASRRGHTDAD